MPTNYEPLVLTIEPAYVGSAVSPTVDITETTDDVTVTITDVNGEHSYTIEKTDQAVADAQAAASAANSAASAASTAATRASTSADNADSATTAANSAAASATQAAVDTEAATTAANSAASSATTAAASANAAADRVDTAIASAESAATAANSAATSASNAASAANTAATLANTKAGLADTAATNANTKAGLADTAAQSANSAASTASTAASNADAKATAANTAASAANNAAARVDAALETLDDDLKITDSASGESVTAADASYLNALVVDGKSVQDGTPTPENPVSIQVVEGINIWDGEYSEQYTHFNTATGVFESMGGWTLTDRIPALPNTQYYAFLNQSSVGENSCVVGCWDSEDNYLGYSKYSNGSGLFTTKLNTAYIHLQYTNTVSQLCINISNPALNGIYLPYECIGLKIGDTVTPIDLQGNVLASLPDGTKDVLKIDSAGHVTIEKKTWIETISAVGTISASGTYASITPSSILERKNWDSVDDMANDVGTASPQLAYCSMLQPSINSIHISRTWNGIYVYSATGRTTTQEDIDVLVGATFVARNKTQIIDLGYIEPPAITSGSVITVLATLTPTITPKWWTSRAAAIPEALAASKQHIEDTSADDASIAPVESSTAVSNHPIGALIMLDGMLYKVTSAIATGEAITPGTNCTQTTVAAELAALA